MLEQLIRDVRPDADFEMASNPEFLREGSAVEDFLRPDRIVVGLSAGRARERMSELYRPLMLRDLPVLFTTFETAELIKYAANAYPATRIGFINEMADLCEAVGADVAAVTRGMGLDRRIGLHYLQPGPGFGGSCFPKDTRALASIARQAGARAKIVEAVIDSNNLRKESHAERIGVSFKAETDDLREAASLAVIPALQRAGANIAAYDPVAIAAAKQLLSHVEWCEDAYETAKDAHAVVVLTEWNEFRGLDLWRLAAQMRQPVLIDLRNIYSAGDVAKTPFIYHSIGRPTVMPGRE
jgi:UDPglucose 6-dehydrogenase